MYKDEIAIWSPEIVIVLKGLGFQITMFNLGTFETKESFEVVL